MLCKNKYFSIICGLIFVMHLTAACGCLADSEQKLFSSDEKAVKAFITAIKNNDNQKLLKIFGKDANELIHSGDEVADQQRREMFIKAYDEQHTIQSEGDSSILVVGKNEWPFPIPIVKQGKKWMFDTAAGKQEILDRRIGYNELSTIQVMLAIVDAQREYAQENHDNEGLHVYAQKFKSDPNTEDGLYWETKEGQKPSPLGPLVSASREKGYFEKETSKPQPYHGYYYRILTAQGENASGGAYDYIINGKMIGGFAVIAWPSDYGNSGVMTFIVSNDGVVYQKDLGEDTENQAQKIKLFDPDKSWEKVEE
jgi:hypothetical protein